MRSPSRSRTDDPDERFAAGAVLGTDPADRGPLTVTSMRRSGPVLVLGFDGFADRNAAETLRGTSLTLDAVAAARYRTTPTSSTTTSWSGWPSSTAPAAMLGTVVEVLHPPAAPVLAVDRPDGSQELVPFVSAIVPEVDLDGRPAGRRPAGRNVRLRGRH